MINKLTIGAFTFSLIFFFAIFYPDSLKSENTAGSNLKENKMWIETESISTCRLKLYLTDSFPYVLEIWTVDLISSPPLGAEPLYLRSEQYNLFHKAVQSTNLINTPWSSPEFTELFNIGTTTHNLWETFSIILPTLRLSTAIYGESNLVFLNIDKLADLDSNPNASLWTIILRHNNETEISKTILFHENRFGKNFCEIAKYFRKDIFISSFFYDKPTAVSSVKKEIQGFSKLRWRWDRSHRVSITPTWDNEKNIILNLFKYSQKSTLLSHIAQIEGIGVTEMVIKIRDFFTPSSEDDHSPSYWMIALWDIDMACYEFSPIYRLTTHIGIDYLNPTNYLFSGANNLPDNSEEILENACVMKRY